LPKTIIVCEGKKDITFVEEIINYKKSLLNSMKIKSYSVASLLVDDIRLGKQADISILNGNGFPGCIEVAIHLSRQLWYIDDLYSIGVIADSDKGQVYQKTGKYLEDYLNTPCKKHNICPNIYRFNSEEIIKISFGNDHNIFLWTLEVPESLEIKMSKALKRKYPFLRKIKTEDETLAEARNKLNKTIEELVKLSVKLFKNEPWFTKFCGLLLKRIKMECPSQLT